MELEDQIVSLELAEQLNKLLFYKKYDSYYQWKSHRHPLTGEAIVCNLVRTLDTEIDYDTKINTYTVAELGEILPKEISVKSKLTGQTETKVMRFLTDDISEQVNNYYGVDKYRLFLLEIGNIQKLDRKEADARAKMLIYLKENNLI